MGTRHLTIVQKDNQYKVVQYGQWDGYPEGQGATILKFLRKMNVEKFEKQLERITVINEKMRKLSKLIDKVFEKVNNQYQLDSKANDWKSDKTRNLTADEKFLYQCFTRDTGGKILDVIYNAPKDAPIYLSHDLEFAGDSLFCEWAYVVNLDEMTLEVYRGFNFVPLEVGERFSGIKPTDNSYGYKQIKLLKTYSLKRLPTEKTFLKQLKTLSNKAEKINEPLRKEA